MTKSFPKKIAEYVLKETKWLVKHPGEMNVYSEKVKDYMLFLQTCHLPEIDRIKLTIVVLLHHVRSTATV